MPPKERQDKLSFGFTVTRLIAECFDCETALRSSGLFVYGCLRPFLVAQAQPESGLPLPVLSVCLRDRVCGTDGRQLLLAGILCLLFGNQ